jgi:hypothetical protein
MKVYLIAPALVLVGLVACSKETSVPVSSTAAAESAAATAPARPVDALADLPDQLTAEEIQARREAWVSEGAASRATASNTTASNTEAAAPRVAAAPVPSRE